MKAVTNKLSTASIALLLVAATVNDLLAGTAEEEIRARLQQWAKDFNAGNAEAACGLFSTDLRYDFRGYPERGYNDICALLRSSLRDESKRYAYGLDIREVITSGDLAVVRLTWTLTVTMPNGQVVTSVEPGMDVFRRDPNGQWKIIRYLAYEAPARPNSRGE